MSKSLEYDLPKVKLKISPKYQPPRAETLRRVWVQRLNGNPTTIMMGRDCIVDDLKLAVCGRFPNTLARYCDPSDLQIRLNPKSFEKMHQARYSKRKSSMLRLKQDPDDGVNKQASNTPNGVRTINFEPDQNVWQIIDECFAGSMSMSDALIVEVDTEVLPSPLQERYNYHAPNVMGSRGIREEESQSPLQKWGSQLALPTSSDLHNPRPQYPQYIKSKLLIKNSSLSPRIVQRSSPSSSAHQGLHKRSNSNPSQSPESLNQRNKSSNQQAVLLLPKNFSLGEQHSLKRFSLDESLQEKSYGLKNNVTNIGTSSDQSFTANVRPHDLKQSSFSKSESNIDVIPLLSLEGTSSSENRKTNDIDTLSAANNSKPQTERIKLKEKTINTSTFEKVLPLISVLVVEDNTINQAILGAFLRKHKIRYQIAKNGQEAVDKWRKGGFHLVLMDIQLPVKSGIDATKEIRSLEKINRIGVFAQHELTNSNWGQSEIKEEQKLDLNIFRSPVIIVALTASSNSSVDKKNALTAGCNDFLTKPVNLVWLQNKITEWGCMQALIDFDGWKFKENA